MEDSRNQIITETNPTTSMQYLVSEVLERGSAGFGAAKVFKNPIDAVRYLQKLNKGDRLLIGEKELTPNLLENLLAERLATVSVLGEFDGKKWTISAF